MYSYVSLLGHLSSSSAFNFISKTDFCFCCDTCVSVVCVFLVIKVILASFLRPPWYFLSARNMLGCRPDGYVHVSAVVRGGQKRALDPLEMELQEVMSHPMWVLGKKLRSSACTPYHHWAVPPGPRHTLFCRSLTFYIYGHSAWLFQFLHNVVNTFLFGVCACVCVFGVNVHVYTCLGRADWCLVSS